MEISRQSLHDRQIALIQYYLARLEDAREMLTRGSGQSQDALRAFDQDWQQLQTQQQWAVRMALCDKQAAALVSSFPVKAGRLLLQVDTAPAMRWLDDGLAWSAVDNAVEQFELFSAGYEIHKTRKDPVRMREMIEGLEALFEHLDPPRRSRIAQLKTRFYDATEAYEQALTQAEYALSLALQAEDASVIALAYEDIGVVCSHLEQYSRGEEYLQQAIVLFRQQGERLREGIVLNSLAISAYSRGDFPGAVDYAEQALVIIRDFGQRSTELLIQGNLTLLLMGISDLERARFHGQQVLKMARERGSGDTEETVLGALVMIAATLGLADETRQYADQARAYLVDIPSGQLASIAAYALWMVTHEQGDWLAACRCVEENIEQVRDTNYPENEFLLMDGLGFSLLNLGRLDEAAAAFGRCLELRDENYEQPHDRASALTGLCLVEARRGRLPEAQKLLDEFMPMLADQVLETLDIAAAVAWSAYQAALLLEDERASVVLDSYRVLLEKRLNYLHDEHLRQAYQNQYSVRQMRSVLA